MAMSSGWISFWGSAATGAILAGVCYRWREFLPLDVPNERSLHERPTPRTGGLALWPAVAVGTYLSLGSLPTIFLFVVGLAIISFLDDRWGLPVLVRLVVQIMGVGFWLILDVERALPFTLFVGLCLALVWAINLFNFMDGSDGLAGGMAVIGFSAYATQAWFRGDTWMTLLALSLVGAFASFLLFNFPPAKMFLGDVGSIPLGFLASALGVKGWTRDLWPAWFPVCVFAPFFFDAGITLARRVLNGEKFWRAHRGHYYQRLARMGWSHRRIIAVEYPLMALCALSALMALRIKGFFFGVVLGTVLLVLIALMWLVDERWKISPAMRKG